MSAIPFVTDEATYDEAIRGPVPVLVDFTATWCGPCTLLAPALEEIGAELEDRLRIVKVDIDEAAAIAGRYGIQSVPTLMLFEQGEALATLVGAKPKRELLAVIDALLS